MMRMMNCSSLVRYPTSKLWYANIKTGQNVIQFKLDTRSQVNIIQKQVYDMLTNIELWQTKCCLLTYLDERIKPLGEVV